MPNRLLRLLRCGRLKGWIKAPNPLAQVPPAIRRFAIRGHHGNYHGDQHQNTEEDQPKTARAHGDEDMSSRFEVRVIIWRRICNREWTRMDANLEGRNRREQRRR